MIYSRNTAHIVHTEIDQIHPVIMKTFVSDYRSIDMIITINSLKSACCKNVNKRNSETILLDIYSNSAVLLNLKIVIKQVI